MENQQKREFNLLKHSLEKWRELILLVYTILIWEQKYYPAVIVGVVTFAYILFWYLDLTFVTSIALFGLTLTLFDYFYPKLARMVFKSDNWTATHENKYEQVVEKMFQIKNKAKLTLQFIISAKEEKSTLFILATSTVCIAFAYIGSTFNNLFLGYLTSLILLLYPGFLSQGHLKFLADFIDSRINFHYGSAVATSQSGPIKKDN